MRLSDDPFGLDKFVGKTQKSKRNTISKTEWETLKSTHGNKCVLCGKSKKKGKSRKKKKNDSPWRL